MSYLTRKQKWRRCRPTQLKSKTENNSLYFRSAEWQDVLPSVPKRPEKAESWSHPPRRNIYSTQAQEQQGKNKVSFDDSVKVVLIPSHRDIAALVPRNEIWWDESDYLKFVEFAQRIKEHYGGLSPQEDEITFEDCTTIARQSHQNDTDEKVTPKKDSKSSRKIKNDSELVPVDHVVCNDIN
mmetsp:Transcript_25283/g.32985  ORF Transcript_25283/g.32985 Transcript_25283/m.32985 type:complete len:182 (-) Transcript_25283:282-827(-)